MHLTISPLGTSPLARILHCLDGLGLLLTQLIIQLIMASRWLLVITEFHLWHSPAQVCYSGSEVVTGVLPPGAG